MASKSKGQKQRLSYCRLCGIPLLIYALSSLIAYLGLGDIGLLNSLDNFNAHLLGRVSLLLPLGLGLWGWHLLRGGSLWTCSRTTLIFMLVMLCLSGTAHQFFTPMGKELYPEYLPQGGGLIGGSLLLLGRRLLGINWTLVLLGLLWVITLGLVVPWRRLWQGWQKERASRAKLEEALSKKPQEQFRQATAAVEHTAEPRKHQAAGICSVYHQQEFSSFTEGIAQEKPLHRLLKLSGGAYATKELREQVKHDPVQIPNWQKEVLVHSPSVEEELPPVALEAPVILEQDLLPFKPQQAPSEPISSQPVQEPIRIVNSADKQAVTSQEQPQRVAETMAYVFPPLDLLDTPRQPDYASYKKDIMEQCAILEQTLSDFKVHAKVTAVTRGPSVTRFELEPAPGVKVSSVVNLADDIALKLAAAGVRIEAPIPGKAAIGIEAPNIKNDQVFFREVVDNEGVRQAAGKLNVGLGKNISGDIIAVDLAKMPHLLVAGSTGSGKSVCINTIIAGLLYKASPDEVKLILVDPKVVELSNYNGIPHLLTPVVTDAKQAASALHWAVAEMERRYQQFAQSHVREINSYNQQAEEKMPFIVIIIDELADLMMVAKVDVEDAILRLAQKARAAGIHLILATQRPSVDVITGIVKANIPSRISFAVSSQTDSRTILDMGGAEKLLGKGDMLFYPIGQNKPLRVQGAFVSDAELNRLVDFIVQQSIPVEYSDEVITQTLECEDKVEDGKDSQDYEDELFEDALRLVMDLGQASSSMLQRRFRIGYTRAARLVDSMEAQGIVGQAVGSKPREVILSREEIEARFLKHV